MDVGSASCSSLSAERGGVNPVTTRSAVPIAQATIDSTTRPAATTTQFSGYRNRCRAYRGNAGSATKHSPMQQLENTTPIVVWCTNAGHDCRAASLNASVPSTEPDTLHAATRARKDHAFRSPLIYGRMVPRSNRAP